MKAITRAVLQTGLVDEDQINEMARWGLVMRGEEIPDESPPTSVEAVAHLIQETLESMDYVRMQDMDFDILQRWLDKRNHLDGRLVLEHDSSKRTAKIVYFISSMGEIVMPWKDENIMELLLNTKSHLRAVVDGVEKRYFFSDARELYVGDVKAFMACTIDTSMET